MVSPMIAHSVTAIPSIVTAPSVPNVFSPYNTASIHAAIYQPQSISLTNFTNGYPMQHGVPGTHGMRLSLHYFAEASLAATAAV